MTRLLSLTGCLFLSFALSAQPDSVISKYKITYFNQLTSGGLFGEKGDGAAFSARMIHGICTPSVGAGIGIGYDSYTEWNTMPLFVSARITPGFKKTRGVFFQVNYGHSVAQLRLENDDFYTYESEGGRMTGVMGGYQVRSGNLTIYVMAGYQFQRISYTQTSRWEPFTSSVERDIERFAVYVGIGVF